MATTVITTGDQVTQTPPLVPSAGVTPLPFTKMPLFDWASRLGLNPIHFGGAVVSGRFVRDQACSTPWPRYTWQNGSSLSHMDISVALSIAESLIEEYIGYHVAPATRVETHPYPRYLRLYRTNGRDTTGRSAAIQMERGKIKSVSVEKRTLLGTFPLTYQDLDGDGYNEVAQVVVSDAAVYPATEIQLFPAGLADHPSWQIRYPKRWWQVGQDYNFLIDFWMLINPEFLARLPGEFWEAPNLDSESTRLTHVDVYRVWQDSTDTASVSLEWEPDWASCVDAGSNTLTTSGAVGIVRDPEAGLVAPRWSYGSPETGRSPDRATISYHSGVISDEYRQGYSLNPLGGYLADAVFYLATARLTRDLCGCEEARAYAIDLRTDMSLVSPQGNFLAVADDIQTCPFGTRRGEWLAFKALTLMDKHIEVGVF